MQLVLSGCALSSPPELNTRLVICRTMSSPFLHPQKPPIHHWCSHNLTKGCRSTVSQLCSREEQQGSHGEELN